MISSLDDFREVRPNFTLDDDLQPFTTAPGKKADFEVEYNNTFILLVEVTLTSGARQYDTESEPVTRHIGRVQFEEQKKAKPRVESPNPPRD
ncbi:MAG: AlwI family type II restriction endonuclease [Chloroflexota bacterium]